MIAYSDVGNAFPQRTSCAYSFGIPPICERQLKHWAHKINCSVGAVPQTGQNLPAIRFKRI